MNITWKIDNIECQTQIGNHTDAVYTLHWKVFASAEGSEANVYGSCIVDFVEGETFIPYSELTEEQALSWVFAALGENGKADAELGATSILESILAPKIVSKPLPWNV